MQRSKTLDNLEITWLGTSSAAPGKTRNTSGAALRLDGEMWMIDLGEATQHQVQRSKLKIGSATKIFLTHMHGDHAFGLVPFLCALADGAGGVLEGADWREREAMRSPPIDIYGLRGTRRLIRTTLECTYTKLARRYRVHELLFEHDEAHVGRPHRQEMPGRDLRINAEGYWPDFLSEDDKMQASAVPIKHTVPCVGFIFKEHPRPEPLNVKELEPLLKRNKEALALEPYNLRNHMQVLGILQREGKPFTLPDGTVLPPPAVLDNGRKVVILGDTYDAESDAMDKVATGADLLVHEATNAFLPEFEEKETEAGTYEELAKKTKSHGHSTPQVAGQFARRIGAKSLFLNHFSARYVDAGSTLEGPAPVHVTDEVQVVDLGVDRKRDNEDKPAKEVQLRLDCMKEIEKQASDAWESGRRAVATRDFMSAVIKRRRN